MENTQQRMLSPAAEPSRPSAGWLRLRGLNWFVRWTIFAVLFGFITGPFIGMIAKFMRSGYWIGYSGSASFVRMFLISGSFGALMTVSFLIVFGLPARYLYPVLKQYPRIISLPLQVAAISTGAVFMFILRSYLLWHMLGVPSLSGSSLQTVFGMSVGFSIMLALLIGAFARLRSEVKQAEGLLYESKLKEKELIEQATVAQLRALQAQINPHFFFNTLSAIIALLSNNTEAAREMLTDLAEMYRYVLRCSNTGLVSLEDEIEFVKSYLRIEEVRFQDRLEIDLRVVDNLAGLMLPGLTLQPIVENAIKHGIARNVQRGHIRIHIERGSERFTIRICNTTEQPVKLKEEELFVDGHALKNVSQRLSALYGAGFDLEIGCLDQEFCVRLAIPVGLPERRLYA
jgi:sensor histidine kinase YesM